jgi:hypothetical protein
MPAWWMSVMKNMVISSQKTQGLDPDGEPCDLGVESTQNGSPANSAGPGHSDEEKAYKEEEENRPCGFMCRMKKGFSKAKEPVKILASESKTPKMDSKAMANDAKDEQKLKDDMNQASLVRIAKEKASEVKEEQ